jgi:molecular chaperone HscB
VTLPNHYALLGLPQAYAIDTAALDAAWRRMQAAVHPDRHADGSHTERRLALQRATQVNEAYRVLRDPQRRAAYLCELAGVDLAVESNTAMPGAFLVQQMTWREALGDARSQRDPAALESLRGEVGNARDALLARVGHLLDIDRDPVAAAAEVRRLMFLDRLLEEIELADEALAGL